MHRIRALTLTSVLLAAATAAPPKTRAGEPREARASPLGLVIELRSDFGLEKLNEIEFTTGRRVGMRLNEGISGALGVSFLPLAGGRLSTRLTGGYKFQYLRASNGDAWFTGIPLELAEMVYVGPVRLSVGGSLLLEPQLRGNGFLQDQTRRYDPSPGAVAELEWLVSARSRTGIGVRGTWSRFTADGVTRDGPAIGVVVRTDPGADPLRRASRPSGRALLATGAGHAQRDHVRAALLLELLGGGRIGSGVPVRRHAEARDDLPEQVEDPLPVAHLGQLPQRLDGGLEVRRRRRAGGRVDPVADGVGLLLLAR